MSLYDDLRNAFSAHQDANCEFCEENTKIAVQIVDGFRTYVEAPESFATKNLGTSLASHYVTFHQVNEDGSVEESPVHVRDAVTSLSDGSFNLGMGIILERSEGHFPKNRHLIPLYGSRRGEEVEIQFSKDPRPSDPKLLCRLEGSSVNGLRKVHRAIYELIMKTLKRRPGEGPETESPVSTSTVVH